jgi:arginyl-tRNA synthetase
MNEEMIKKMKVTDTKPTYESLKSREKELLAQLHELKEEIANAEKDIINEKLNTAIQYLADVDEMTNSFYRCTVGTYCENCEESIEADVDLAEIIEALQQLR